MSDWEDDPEEPDESDRDDRESADLATCPHCGQEVYEDAEVCPHCGNYISEHRGRTRKPLWLVIAATVVALAMLLHYTIGRR